MLRLDLARLERDGSVRLEAEVPSDDPMWNGSDLSFEGPASVDLRAQEAVSGDIVVRGRVEGTLRFECRRCLDPVLVDVDEELTIVYAPENLLAVEDVETRPIPDRARDLDLGAAVREELILALDPFVVCDSACRGLCPKCGVNLNQQTCDCVTGEPDSRWDVLRTPKSE